MLLPILFVYSLAVSLALTRRAPARASSEGIVKTQSSPLRVLIVGATGGTGRQLVEQALQRGFAVTALVRTPSRLGIVHSQLRLAQGDVFDIVSLDAAVRGQDAVVCALGHKRWFYPNRILSEGTLNLLRTMETHGVRRFVCMTSLGIGSSAGRLGLLYTFFTIPFVLPFYFWDKLRQERVIAESRVDWVIVRPGALNNAQRRGVYRHGPDAGHFLWTVRISRADVADFLLNQIIDDSYVGAAPGLCW